MKLLIALMAAFALTGCAVGHTEYASETLSKSTLHFVGVPGVLSLTGSSTPVNASYSLTAAHVAKVMPALRVVAYHPTCDIALVKHENDQYPAAIGRTTLGKPIDLYGYSSRTMLPLHGAGVVSKVIHAPGCTVFNTTAGAMQGMSGGAAYQGGKLVGIIIAINTKTDESVIVPLQTLAPWLAQWGIKP